MTESSRPVRGFFGMLLMLVGGLIAILSGACTAVVIAAVGMDNAAGRAGMLGGDLMSWVGAPLIIGGLPFLVGVGLFVLGRALWGRR